MAILNDNNKKESGSAIFTTEWGTGKQGNISTVGDHSSGNDRGNTLYPNKALSAGGPGSAGIVGSKRWMKSHTDQTGNVTADSDHTSNL